jgi:hypothetical protein
VDITAMKGAIEVMRATMAITKDMMAAQTMTAIDPPSKK